MMIHNHPSGDIIPSAEDIRVTNNMYSICKPQSPVLNFMLGMLVPFAFPFVLFSCANAYIRRAEDAQAIEAAGVPEEAASEHDPE